MAHPEQSPGSSIVGEELGDSDGGGAIGWIVDPLDGTVNFAYDLPVIRDAQPNPASEVTREEIGEEMVANLSAPQLPMPVITEPVGKKPDYVTEVRSGDNLSLIFTRAGLTALVMFLVYVGYLAFRRVPADPGVRARRAAVIGIIGALQIPIVRFSVQWWENSTLHQQGSLTDGKLENLTLFTWFIGQVVLGAIFLWLLVHRFRLAWLEEEIDTHGLVDALEERRAEAMVGVDEAVGGSVDGRVTPEGGEG